LPESEATLTTAVSANAYRMINLPPVWLIRRGPMVKILDSTQPDLICVQECTETQESYLLEKMTGPWGSASDHVNVGVMFRTDRYRCIDSRPFTLKNKSSQNRNRYASGALLQPLDNESPGFCVVSPHLASSGDGLAAQSRPYQTEQLLDQLQAWGVLEMPCVLGGDWNDSSNTTGIVPVLKARGFTDVRAKLGKGGASIDRFFTNTTVTPTDLDNIPTGIASDHDFKRAVFAVGTLTPLQLLEAKHGKVVTFKIGSFEAARIGGYPSRYVAIVQDWLGREVTTQWGTADQIALDQWRHAEFPAWPKPDYTGPVGPTSMNRLREIAAAAGKTVYPVVK
jgi:endonuclease/exonuclease/phosphatase family metal-dependent hydrolase